MDTRRRISFNMNTGGGQPSEPSTGGTYTVNLNGQWEKTTVISNPDSTLYDGVYRSSSSYNVDNGVSTMYIDISGYSEFTLYIRSYAEGSWDYVMVSELDKTITSGSSTTDTTLVKAHTKGHQKSGTTISDYTEVKYTNIDGGSHRITILYRKDGSVNSGDDRGYVLIPKSNGSSGGGGSTPDNPGTGGDISGPINTSNYMTILALENGLTAKLSTNACQYCVDGDGNWIDLPSGTTTQSINQGQTLSFKGNLTPNSSTGIGRFTISKKCNLEGNCMSLLFGDDAVNNNSLSGKNYAFYKLFSGCTTIIQVSELFLPATTLANRCYYEMFKGCSSLTTAPELPATTLASDCYNQMFSGCSGLTSAPELPATTLTGNCYYSMFYGCSSLTTAPSILPATTLASNCYYYMFYKCTSLTTAPELPATRLATGCYRYMFNGCSSLTTAPVLPATTLASNCYDNMFCNCSGLTSAPELPATRLADYCYYFMFDGCTSLTVAPELPATTLANHCYGCMFQGCSSLTTASELPATTLDEYCYVYMFSDCTSLTTAPELPATTLAKYCYESMFQDCTSLTTAPELPATTLADNCYHQMFYSCRSLTTAPELPATRLAKYCYKEMFRYCSSLTTAPELPATSLYYSCYNSMFYGCSSLTTALELPATRLAEYCYHSMFYGTNVLPDCSNIDFTSNTVVSSGGLRGLFAGTDVTDNDLYNILPINPATGKYWLPATTLAKYCYEDMFNSCYSLTVAPELPATTLADYCYFEMFYDCWGLTTAPELPATTLTRYCYYYMFHGCSKLKYIKMLATDISASNCLNWWVANISSTGTFVKNPAMTSLPSGNSGIPSGWRVVNDN